MNILEEIIQGMDKDEVRNFKLLTAKIEYGFDRKDIKLFDMLRKSPKKMEEERIIRRLYKQAKRNPYYRLRNRLHDQLNKSLLLHHFESDDDLTILFWLSLFRLFFKKKQLKVAKYYLLKAERQSIHLEKFDMLDIIYSEFIRLSNEIADIDPELYVKKQRQNWDQLNKLREIDQILASMTYRLRVSQNFADNDQSLIQLMEKTIRDFSPRGIESMSTTLQLRMAEAVSKTLLQKHDYTALGIYIISTLKKFKKKKFFNPQNHHIKLTLLTYLINSLYYEGKFAASLKYAEELHSAMLEYDRMHYNRYLIFYYNAKVINYSAIDRTRAISLLEELKQSKTPLGYYEFYIYLNLALLYFEEKQFDKAIRHVLKAYLFESFEKSDNIFKLKVALAELIIRSDLGENAMVKHRIRQIKKDFPKILSDQAHLREKNLVEIIYQLSGSKKLRENKKLQNKIHAFLEATPKNYNSENEVIKYNSWLESKLAVQ